LKIKHAFELRKVNDTRKSTTLRTPTRETIYKIKQEDRVYMYMFYYFAIMSSVSVCKHTLLVCFN